MVAPAGTASHQHGEIELRLAGQHGPELVFLLCLHLAQVRLPVP